MSFNYQFRRLLDHARNIPFFWYRHLHELAGASANALSRRLWEHEALFTIDWKVFAGDLPGRAKSLVREWIGLHREESELDWQLAQQKKPLNPIDPLE